jgi:hypothetical protein
MNAPLNVPPHMFVPEHVDCPGACAGVDGVLPPAVAPEQLSPVLLNGPIANCPFPSCAVTAPCTTQPSGAHSVFRLPVTE